MSFNIKQAGIAANVGLKSMTKPHSTQVRLAKGGKTYTNDTSKPNRKYKLKGETR